MRLCLNFSICFVFLFLGGCAYTPPSSYSKKIIETNEFDLVSWQKLDRKGEEITFYIEGDGHAFNANGYASQDPTPREYTLRKIAFRDTDANVVYLARPCQYVMSERCNKKYWTTGRFSQEVITAEASAIKQIMHDNNSSSAVLVGYSGGAMVAGLVSVQNPDLGIRKIITIAGLLEHKKWSRYHNVLPLKDSLDLSDYQEQFSKIPQHHFIAEQDNIVIKELTPVSKNNQTIIKGTTHSTGWDNFDLKTLK